MPGPSGHVTARAPSRRESRQALCARLRRCLPSPRREGEERRSDQASGVRCACAANSCHLVRNKSSKFPESLWAGGHLLPPHLPSWGRVSVPTRAPGNRFSGVRRRERWGEGLGRSSRHCPPQRRAAGGGWRLGQRGRRAVDRSVPGLCGCHAGERVASYGRSGGRREPVTVRSGPLGGFGPRARRSPGGRSPGRAPWGRGARGWSRGADSFPFPLQPDQRRTPERHGLLRPRCHLFFGTVTTRGVKAGARLQNTSQQAGRLSPGFVLSSRAALLVFPARGHFFLQYLKSRCGVDSGCLINELDRFAWNARHVQDVA